MTMFIKYFFLALALAKPSYSSTPNPEIEWEETEMHSAIDQRSKIDSEFEAYEDFRAFRLSAGIKSKHEIIIPFCTATEEKSDVCIEASFFEFDLDRLNLNQRELYRTLDSPRSQWWKLGKRIAIAEVRVANIEEVGHWVSSRFGKYMRKLENERLDPTMAPGFMVIGAFAGVFLHRDSFKAGSFVTARDFMAPVIGAGTVGLIYLIDRAQTNPNRFRDRMIKRTTRNIDWLLMSTPEGAMRWPRVLKRKNYLNLKEFLLFKDGK